MKNVFARYDLATSVIDAGCGQAPPAARAALVAAGIPEADLEMHQVGEVQVLVIRDEIGDWVYDGSPGPLQLVYESQYAQAIPEKSCS